MQPSLTGFSASIFFRGPKEITFPGVPSFSPPLPVPFFGIGPPGRAGAARWKIRSRSISRIQTSSGAQQTIQVKTTVPKTRLASQTIPTIHSFPALKKIDIHQHEHLHK